MKYFDSHCHIDLEPLSTDMEGTIERAAKVGVTKMINIGSSMRGSRRSVEIANLYPNIWATVGLHPHDAEGVLDIKNTLEELELLAVGDQVVGIGEIGLDYYGLEDRHSREGGNPDSWADSRNDIVKKQKKLFEEQLLLAKRLKLPVVIHIRDAWNDFLQLVTSHQSLVTRGVIHCFTGDKITAQKLLDLGFYIGFTGFVTFDQPKFDHIREAAKIVPIEKLLIETDAPFLAPEPYRGKTNEPAYVVAVAKKIAELKNLNEKEVAAQTFKNAENLFGLTR